MQKTPQELREKARKLLKQAEELENKKTALIGKLVLTHRDDDFAGFDLKKFKAQIEEILGKKGIENAKAQPKN